MAGALAGAVAWAAAGRAAVAGAAKEAGGVGAGFAVAGAVAGTCYTYRHVSESNPPRKGHMYIPRTHCATMVAHGQAHEYMRPQ